MHDSLFVFDIETVPDIDVLPQLTGQTAPDPQTGRQMLEQYHLDITNGRNGFARQPFHKVVAISFLRATIQRDGQRGKRPGCGLFLLLRQVISPAGQFQWPRV